MLVNNLWICNKRYNGALKFYFPRVINTLDPALDLNDVFFF